MNLLLLLATLYVLAVYPDDPFDDVGLHTHIGMCGYRVTCAAPPTRPFPRPRRGRQAAGHSPVGSNNFRSPILYA